MAATALLSASLSQSVYILTIWHHCDAQMMFEDVYVVPQTPAASARSLVSMLTGKVIAVEEATWF